MRDDASGRGCVCVGISKSRVWLGNGMDMTRTRDWTGELVTSVGIMERPRTHLGPFNKSRRVPAPLKTAKSDDGLASSSWALHGEKSKRTE